MRNIFILICTFIIASYFIGCNKSNNTISSNTCDSITLIKSPLTITWIQQIVAGNDCMLIQGAKMSTCTYKNQIVVYLENALSNQGVCDYTLYSCSGTKLLRWGDAGWSDFLQNYTDKKTFWTK
jgi:hypothetical protein